jgi:hypothetical protein
MDVKHIGQGMIPGDIKHLEVGLVERTNDGVWLEESFW